MNKLKWQKLSLAEQLGNIGSEVNRAIYWKEKGEKKTAKRAAERVLNLIDLTIDDLRWSGRLKEIVRLREIFCDYFFDYSNYKISPRMLKNYFLPFAFLARRKV